MNRRLKPLPLRPSRMSPFVCNCGKIEERKINLSSELVKAGGYDITHPCCRPQNNHLCFKRSLVTTEFDMSGLHKILLISNGDPLKNINFLCILLQV